MILTCLCAFRRYLLSFVCLFLSLLGAALAATAEIVEQDLGNGLKVIVKPDTRAPVAAVMVWYRAGSIDEVNGGTGVAHVLEHLMFQGTDSVAPGEYAKTIASVGGRSNAFTSSDYTGYLQELHSDELELAIKLEADRMQNLLLRQTEFDNEVRVVMEERRQRVDDNPRGVLMEQLSAAMYVAHPYRAPVIGWMNDLENMTLTDASDWYQRWYVPNNAALVVAGNVEPEEVFLLAKRYFGGVESRDLPMRKPQDEPLQLGDRRIVVKENTTLPSQAMAFRAPRLENVDSDWEPYALYLLAGVLDGHAAARLHKRMVVDEMVAQSVSVSYDGLKRGPGSFFVGFSPVKGVTVDDLETIWWDEVERLKRDGIAKQELSRVKAQVIAGQIFSDDSVLGQASRIGRMWAIGYDSNASDLIHKKIKTITPDQVRAVAEKYLVTEAVTVAVLLPKQQN